MILEFDESNELYHYGIKRRSGRYPWGSGNKAYQHAHSWNAQLRDMLSSGMSQKDAAKAMGVLDKFGEGDIAKLRNYLSISRNMSQIEDIYRCKKMSEEGNTPGQIAKVTGISETRVKNFLDDAQQEKFLQMETLGEKLKEQIIQKKLVDVGKGAELELGVSRTMLDSVLADIEDQGFRENSVSVTQIGTGKQTWMRVMSEEDYPREEVYKHRNEIESVDVYYDKDNDVFTRNEPVKSISSDRVLVKFDETGGTDRDGIIQLRQGVEDLTLPGDSRYSQVRIAVDDSRFLKGMAVYTDDIPDGYDVIYNTSKKQADGPLAAMKPYDEAGTPDNPFGSSVRQLRYTDKDGNEQLSALNVVGYSQKVAAGEEGYWATWNTNKVLASQFLSKQPVDLAEEQLKQSYNNRKAEYDDIMKITNGAVRQNLLDAFADKVDADAVNLEGAALPRQSVKIIMTNPSLKPNQAYSTDFPPGSEVALIRFPHAGTFEIPKLIVTDKNAEGEFVLGKQAKDAIMIHPQAAAQLSGADSDGDTAIVIPYTAKMKVSDALSGLKDFNNKVYKYPKEVIESESFNDPHSPIHKMTSRENGLQMGMVSNLITDMTVKNAPPDHIERAVKHSMVVIDAPKHNLDWKASARANNIAELQELYQSKFDKNGRPISGGASTLLSRSTSEARIDSQRALRKGDEGYENVVRRGNYSVDLATGKRVSVAVDPTRKPYVNAKGQTVIPKLPQTKSSKMLETDDARTLLSKNPAPIELVYADHANSMKSLANQARLSSTKIERYNVSLSAKKTYAEEIRQLDAAQKIADRNAPVERQAQRLANLIIQRKIEANPNIVNDKARMKKENGLALTAARELTGAGKIKIKITDRQWEAIEAHAVSYSKLQTILKNADMDVVVKHATPKSNNGISSARQAQIKSLLARDYTINQIANMTGVSASTIQKLR